MTSDCSLRISNAVRLGESAAAETPEPRAWNVGDLHLCIRVPPTPRGLSSRRQIPGREKEGENGHPSAPPPLHAELVSPTSSRQQARATSFGPGVPTRTDLSMAATSSNVGNSTATRPARFSLPALRKQTLRPGSMPWISRPLRKVLGRQKQRSHLAPARFPSTASGPVGAGAEVPVRDCVAGRCLLGGKGRGLARCPERHLWAWSGWGVLLGS